VTLYLYKEIFQKTQFTIKQIDVYTRVIGVLFIITLSGYAILQVNTVNNQKPDTSTIGFFTFHRWILYEQNDMVTVNLVNQFTQSVEKSYQYQKMTWNQSLWSQNEIDGVLEKSFTTQEYKNYLFRLNPDTRLVFNVSADFEENNWNVQIIDVFDDAQLKYWGFPFSPFSESNFVIKIPI
jgi:hypothetical protein